MQVGISLVLDLMFAVEMMLNMVDDDDSDDYDEERMSSGKKTWKLN